VSHAQHSGGMIIEQCDFAGLHGQSSRNVVNHGTFELYGQACGRVTGHLPVNALRLDQIVGIDLPVPLTGSSTSCSYKV
jgi:hypothetical protein